MKIVWVVWPLDSFKQNYKSTKDIKYTTIFAEHRLVGREYDLIIDNRENSMRNRRYWKDLSHKARFRLKKENNG